MRNALPFIFLYKILFSSSRHPSCFFQELAFHEEENARNKQVEFLSFQLRLLLLVDYAVLQSYAHTMLSLR